jgi:steroid delta-isomerase-like uncharacterized protein
MKRIVPVIAGLAIAVSPACKKEREKVGESGTATPDSSKTSGAANNQKPAATEMTGEQLIKVTEDCWQAITVWNKDAFRACYADKTDLTAMDTLPPQTAKTPQEVLVLAGVFRNAFPDFKSDLELVLVNGHKAVALGIFSGTHRGRSLGIPPTNKPISLYWAQVIEMDAQGRIVRERDYIDQATLLHQLGVLPSSMAPASEKPWPSKVRAVSKGDPAEQANVQAVKSSFQGQGKAQVDAAIGRYSDDAEFRFVSAGGPTSGKKEISEQVQAYFAGNKDLQVTIRDIWPAGDWVVAETTSKAIVADDLPGAPGTKGKQWEQNALELFQLSGGKVKRHILFANGLKYAADVGLVDPAEFGGN